MKALGKAIIAFAFVIMFLTIGLLSSHAMDLRQDVYNRDKDIEDQDELIGQLRDENVAWATEAYKWKEKYDNFEPKVITEYIYINTTIYDNDTIYIYIDNAIFDVNRDGRVNYYDICEVLWYVKNGLPTLQGYIFDKYGNPYDKLYDVNRDGKVNLKDVDLIQEYSD